MEKENTAYQQRIYSTAMQQMIYWLLEQDELLMPKTKMTILAKADSLLVIEKKQIENSFYVGCKHERGEQRSWETYNKFTGNQKPNKEKNFEQYFSETYNAS